MTFWRQKAAMFGSKLGHTFLELATFENICEADIQTDVVVVIRMM